MKLVWIVFSLAPDIERHYFKGFSFSVFLHFRGFSFGDKKLKVYSLLVTDPILAWNFKPFLTEMVLKGWHEKLVLDFGVDRDLNINNPVVGIIAFESQGAVYVPLTQLFRISHDIDCLSKVNLTLANKPVKSVRHAVTRNDFGILFFCGKDKFFLLHDEFILKKS